MSRSIAAVCPSGARSYSLLLLALTAASAKPRGELVLDARAPFVTAIVAGVPLKLRVDPGQWDAIELAPAAAARLGVRWEAGPDAEVGRVTLAGRSARGEVRVAGGRKVVQLSEHGRAPADDADGLIGPDLLPYVAIRWRRADAPPPSARGQYAIVIDDSTGLVATDPALPGIALRLSLLPGRTEATAAAGARLLARFGGRLGGESGEAPGAFGIARPARRLELARPVLIAGWRLGAIDVRIADYRGREARLAVTRARPDEILVAPQRPGQHGEYWIMLGRDLLDRCAEIAVRPSARTLELACAFDPG